MITGSRQTGLGRKPFHVAQASNIQRFGWFTVKRGRPDSQVVSRVEKYPSGPKKRIDLRGCGNVSINSLLTLQPSRTAPANLYIAQAEHVHLPAGTNDIMFPTAYERRILFPSWSPGLSGLRWIVPVFEKALMTFSSECQKYRILWNIAICPLWWHLFSKNIAKAWLGFLLM